MKLVVYLSVLILLMGGLHTADAAVKDDGLILYFSFDKESGGKIIDETGGGNDATIVADAKIVTDDAVHGKGALLCDTNSSSVTVDSFKELESYKDNTFLFWGEFHKS